MSNQTPSTKKSNKELLDEYEIGFITHGKNVDEHLRNFKQAIQAHIDKKVNEVLDRVEAEAGWYSQQFNDQARKDNIEDTLIRLSSIKKLRSEL
jgi:hypothetical protein